MIGISDIKKFLDDEKIKYSYLGTEDLKINKYTTPDNILNSSILWFKNFEKLTFKNFEEYENLLIVTDEIKDMKNANFLISSNSKELFFSILNKFFYEENKKNYIGKNSIIDTDTIGKDCYIGHNCYISKGVLIGENVVIKNNVVIEGNVKIGDNTIISSGVVIGGEGYGYYQDQDGRNIKVPHFGGVIIGKDVEIGSNTCIDRGTLGDTIIGDNVKIDNLCHIAHNVYIEQNVSIIALSMIAGSVIIKENAYIAPCAAIRNQLKVGKNSIVGLGAVVVNEVEDNVVVAGIPAKVMRRLGED